MQLRDYQIQVIKDIYGFIKDGKKAILVFAPTGSGKTLLAARLIKDALSKGRKVLFCCHRKKLIGQTADTIKKLCGIDAGIIAAGVKPNPDSPVQIGMIQTIEARYKKDPSSLPEDIGLVLFDECHVSVYHDISWKIMEKYSNGIFALSPCYFIGLTATPWRTSAKEGFCQFFQAVVKAPSPRQLVNSVHLTQPRLFSYKTSLEPNKLEVDKDGEYSIGSLIRHCNEEYNKDIIDKYLEVCPNRKAIAFCVGVKQAEDLTKQFNDRGVASDLIKGNTTNDERDRIFADFAKGKIQVLVNINTLSEGFDQTDIEAVILGRPTRSPSLIIQQIGRGLRLHEGKKDCFILDFGGIFDWLETTKVKGVKVVDPIDLSHVPLCPVHKPSKWAEFKECPECSAELPLMALICPECGHEFKEKAKQKPTDVDFPEFTERLTAEEKKQYRFIKDYMRSHFEKRKSPDAVFEQFYSKYGYMPPQDWFVGSVFGVKNPETYARIYVDSLRRSDPSMAIEMVKFLLELEFGNPGRTYLLPFGEKYVAPELELDRFEWWEELGIDSFASTEDIKEAYRQRVDSTKSIEALNYALTTGVKVRGGKY